MGSKTCFNANENPKTLLGKGKSNLGPQKQ
jgi:hypothetical protein